MSSKKGTIALMGSGEMTSTMVEVHKELLAGLTVPRDTVFLDTPAGFQLNVDQLSQRAVEYFRTQVQQDMSIATYKSKELTAPYEAEQAFHTLREAGFILIGPGSPTYAVREWVQSPIPEILINRVEAGGCLVAASAAALTVGRFTVPVYEVYKVGQELHWVEGMNILEHFGFDLVVVPHWNNAEGGTHDTRFCYMGEARFKKLESMLPQDVSIIGLDEHTACLMDLDREEAVIKGIGRVTLRRLGLERAFEKGDRVPLDLLRGEAVGQDWKAATQEERAAGPTPETLDRSFWEKIHEIEESFHKGLEDHELKKTTNALLELDRTIWQAKEDLESDEFISQARDILREMIVTLGVKLESSPKSKEDSMAPLLDKLVDLREKYRGNRQWEEADAIRDTLMQADIVIEDTKNASRWRIKT